MRILLAPTEDFIKVERGVLGADVAAGSTVSANVGNNNGLSNNDYVVIGYEGNELAEMCQINASVTAGATVQLATVKFAHKKGEPWVKYRFNQRKFYGALTETGTYTELTADGSPVSIQVDDPQGTILEYTGVEGYEYFKSTYYNSTSALETSEDDADAVNADESLRYTTIYAIRKHAGLAGNGLYSDQRIEVKRKQAENEINSALASRYLLPLTEVPAILGQICELLAAGYIDFEEFGKDGEGVKWLGEARALLKALQKGSQLLIGVDGTELTRLTNTDKLEGYPMEAQSETSEARIFTIDQQF